MLVTSVLLVLMVLMIVNRGEAPDSKGSYKIADIWQPERSLTEFVKPPKPTRPPELTLMQPSMPTQSLRFDAPAPSISLQAPPRPTGSLQLGLGGDFARDTDYIPVYVPQALYPRRALSRAREGYAVVEVIITTSGGVRGVKLVEESPLNYGFGSAALKAAIKLKYKPRIIDGHAVEVPGVMYKFSFRLE
ncbi:MAG: TonB family protein [Gammaproteobacteria bacterium]|nr:TonB family protein [Gammaproteobacteria bacterium]MBQ0839216.1 TonB family protein [Gammaproteobacteria bacterium]